MQSSSGCILFRAIPKPYADLDRWRQPLVLQDMTVRADAKLIERVSQAIYRPDFFSAMQGAAEPSASVVVPLLMNLLEPKTVIDVGCGEGTWLRTFIDSGVEEVIGIDGDYVPQELL